MRYIDVIVRYATIETMRPIELSCTLCTFSEWKHTAQEHIVQQNDTV